LIWLKVGACRNMPCLFGVTGIGCLPSASDARAREKEADVLEALNAVDPRVALALHAVAALATLAAVLAIAAVLRAPGRPQRGFEIYESGAPVRSAAVAPVPATYFQVAAFFVIFDFEAAVLFTWAVSAPEAGMPGLISAAIFIVVLLVALAYLWADGGLDVGADSRGGAAGADGRGGPGGAERGPA
jgi:NADH-quinone oxidoreductase subunit A